MLIHANLVVLVAAYARNTHQSSRNVKAFHILIRVFANATLAITLIQLNASHAFKVVLHVQVVQTVLLVH